MFLRFDLPGATSHERVRALFEVMAGALLGQPVTLVRASHTPFRDENGGNACFVEEWKAGPVVFVQVVDTLPSNPYDGYPYKNEVTLRLEGRTLRAYHSGSAPSFTSLEVQLEAVTDADRDLLRQALRAELGAKADRSTVSA